MVEVNYVIVDILDLIYNLAWLVFLTRKHYGQVTTRAGHVFELNVLLNNNINIFMWILILDLRFLDGWCTITDTIDRIWLYGFMVAIACSQIETAMFLKTMSDQRMTTTTALKIILAVTGLTSGIAVIITLLLPSRSVCQSNSVCESLKMLTDFHRLIPETLIFVLICGVFGFAIFRSCQIRNRPAIMVPVKYRRYRNTDAPEGQGALFTVQRTMSQIIRELDENQAHYSRNVEDDIVVEDIEQIRIESPQNQAHYSRNVEEDIVVENIEQIRIESHSRNNSWIDQTENHQTSCLPGISTMFQTLNKYLKNSLISLVIILFYGPHLVTAMYGFVTNSGCEDPTLRLMSEISQICIIVLDICLPLLIKLKLDRLSQ